MLKYNYCFYARIFKFAVLQKVVGKNVKNIIIFGLRCQIILI